MKTFRQFLREAVVNQLTPIDNPGDRKYRLFAVGCCRQIWDKITNKRSREAVEVSERFADDKVGPEELEKARDAAYSRWTTHAAAYFADRAAYYAAYVAAHDSAYVAAHYAADCAARADKSVEPRQESLKNCIYIKHPFAFEDLSGNVKSMARRIYEKRDWSYAAMSILADALEEAGCDDPHVFHHCREHKEHARGCLVVDHILGLK